MRRSAVLSKLFLFILLPLVTFVFANSLVFAELVDQTKAALGLPKPTTTQEDNLNLPGSIYITPLRIQADEFITSSDWYKGLYYYQAFRLNQGDFLFHYIVTKDGEIFQGNDRGEEQRFAFKDDQSKPVVIAYLANKDDTDFTTEARKAIGELMIEIANRNRIPLEKIAAKSIEYEVTEQQGIVGVLDITTGRWERGVANIVKDYTPQYNPDNFEFKLAVTNVKVPEGKVKFGQDVVADVTLKNNSNISLYQESEFEPVMSMVGNESFSKFFLNGVWLGPKQTNVMSGGSSIRPGQSKTFKIRLGVPLFFGKQTEKFELVNSLGMKYSGSEFEITLDIEKSEKKAVEIGPNYLGYTNLYKDPSYGAEVVTKVSPGQRFLVLEEGNGWVKIDAGANGKGWIPQGLVSSI